jgi:hypothetical protein
VTIEKGRKHLPPYVSYHTFHNFIERLQQHMPSRIDRSYWGELLSGSNGTQLMAALRFLYLIDINGKPMEVLKRLVEANGDIRVKILHDITEDAYGFVLKSSLDLSSATYAQLMEVFHNTFQLTDDVSRKCVKFFIAMAGEAGLKISPFITRRTRSGRSITGTKSSARKPVLRTNQNLVIPQEKDIIPTHDSWHGMLLNKFPNFDPSWPDDIKLKWFSAFDEMLRKGEHPPG